MMSTNKNSSSSLDLYYNQESGPRDYFRIGQDLFKTCFRISSIFACISQTPCPKKRFKCLSSKVTCHYLSVFSPQSRNNE